MKRIKRWVAIRLLLFLNWWLEDSAFSFFMHSVPESELAGLPLENGGDNYKTIYSRSSYIFYE